MCVLCVCPLSPPSPCFLSLFGSLAVHETTISKQKQLLGAAQKRVGLLMQKATLQQSFIRERIGGPPSVCVHDRRRGQS